MIELQFSQHSSKIFENHIWRKVSQNQNFKKNHYYLHKSLLTYNLPKPKNKMKPNYRHSYLTKIKEPKQKNVGRDGKLKLKHEQIKSIGTF